jgi:hypothetical protein
MADLLQLYCWEIHEADGLPAGKFMKPIANWLMNFAGKDPSGPPREETTC